MAKDSELESFRISDVRRPHVRGGTRPKQVEPEPESSVGFPGIEAQLERGSVEEVAEILGTSYALLEEMAASPDMRKKAAAKKAMVAYERVADLFEYLFETKTALQDGE